MPEEIALTLFCHGIREPVAPKKKARLHLEAMISEREIFVNSAMCPLQPRAHS